jgi:hypothetical protein
MTQPEPAADGRPTIGSYPTYTLAQRAVDYLSDNRFPVQRTAIIGSDLRMVETVLGRLTRGRAAMAGAISGAWFGLFVGVLLALFGTGNSALVILLTAVVAGAVFGAVFGFIAHSATGGRRDFASRSAVVAARYEVIADAEVADEANTLLSGLGSSEDQSSSR